MPIWCQQSVDKIWETSISHSETSRRSKGSNLAVLYEMPFLNDHERRLRSISLSTGSQHSYSCPRTVCATWQKVDVL